MARRKGIIGRKAAKRLRMQAFALVGGFCGAVVGIPVSYGYQSGTLRFFVSMGDYCQRCASAIIDTLTGNTTPGSAPAGVVNTLLIIMAICIFIGAVIGAVLSQLQWRS